MEGMSVLRKEPELGKSQFSEWLTESKSFP